MRARARRQLKPFISLFLLFQSGVFFSLHRTLLDLTYASGMPIIYIYTCILPRCFCDSPSDAKYHILDYTWQLTPSQREQPRSWAELFHYDAQLTHAEYFQHPPAAGSNTVIFLVNCQVSFMSEFCCNECSFPQHFSVVSPHYTIGDTSGGCFAWNACFPFAPPSESINDARTE